MLTIHKYGSIDLLDSTVIKMPQESKILHVGVKDNEVCLWALVDTRNKLVSRTFHVLGTGEELHRSKFLFDAVYRGTWIENNYVWHLFEDSPNGLTGANS